MSTPKKVRIRRPIKKVNAATPRLSPAISKNCFLNSSSFLHELDSESEAKDATDPEVLPDFPLIRRYNLLSETFQYLEVLEFIVSDVIQNTPILKKYYPTCEFFVNVVFGDFIFLKEE